MPSYGSLILPFDTTESVPSPPPVSFLPPKGTPGVVALFEPGHAASGKTGVPSTGESFADPAEEWVVATLGQPSGGFGVTNNIPSSSTQAFVERTAKGGLHAGFAQSGGTTSSYPNYSVGLGTPRRDYVTARAAAGDTFLIASILNITRPAKAGSSVGLPVAALRSTFALSNILNAAGTAGTNAWGFPTDSSRFVGASVEKIGNYVVVVVAAKGPMPSGWTASNTLVLMGPRDVDTLNVVPSIDHKLTYVENLTATGRPFATVLAAIKADFVRRFQTVGGKYNADTWTDPLTKVA
ncbi:hypothetical protein [Pseudoclavibacter sp. VKM Ac-2888]|uniref:hypothetical protein n=1 Tax=Pseudoclavibacter sp. VKM Ac-2888 TaxID=2783830 RepID=UPI00188A97ED|nr:hypothetical protein [Pseudoclavibacter sp. VKM Ac-2888]MBF4549224.1 hypothetical protein [Pseudoclavibacter sp. VKM Ac-2888]